MDRTFWPSLILLIAVFGICELTGIDLYVQDYIYNFKTHTWLIDAKSPLPRLLFYTGPKAHHLDHGPQHAGRRRSSTRKLPFLKTPRATFWIAVLTIATAPALVALGKATTNTFTPAQIRRYEGKVPYVKVIEKYPKNDHPKKRGRAFPAGHASGGFALLSLAGLCTTRRGRIIAISIALTVGTAMGGYQMLKGAHYLSHTLFTAIFCWIIFLLWRRIIHRHSPPPADET